MTTERILSVVAFVVGLASFAVSPIVGWRVVGVEVVLCGCWWVWKRRIPYGFGGQAPAGHLTGGTAVLVGALQVVLGIVLIEAAEYLAAGGARGR